MALPHSVLGLRHRNTWKSFKNLLLQNILAERLVFKHLSNHLRDNNLLSPLESGFIPGDSTVNQLTFFYNIFCKALDSGKEVRAVFCDISKAFDRVWHSGLLYKLQVASVTGEVLDWFKSYLLNRKQRFFAWRCIGLNSHLCRCSSRIYFRTFTLSRIHK